MAEHKYGIIIHESPGEGVGPRYYAGFDDEALATWIRSWPDAPKVTETIPGTDRQVQILRSSSEMERVLALDGYCQDCLNPNHPDHGTPIPITYYEADSDEALAIERLPWDRRFEAFYY